MVGGAQCRYIVLTCKPTTAISAALVKNRLKRLGVGISDLYFWGLSSPCYPLKDRREEWGHSRAARRGLIRFGRDSVLRECGVPGRRGQCRKSETLCKVLHAPPSMQPHSPSASLRTTPARLLCDACSFTETLGPFTNRARAH